jgi:tetratricopeptide (TPR) repeat protein
VKLREAAHLLRAASRTRVLGGRRVRVLHNPWVVAAALSPFLALAVAANAGGDVTGAWLVGELLLAVTLLLLVLTWLRRTTLRNNEAYGALLEGDLAAAERGYLGVLRSPCPELYGSYALANLGHIALLRGELGDAAVLLAAAWEIEHKRWGAGRFSTNVAPGVCAAWAMALACEGKLDEAEQVLTRADVRNAIPGNIAGLVRSRALVALKRGRADEAIATIQAEEALLRNSLGADDTALVRAILASALVKTGGAYRGTTRTACAVPVDPEARAYVLRALPDAGALLADE